MRRLLGISAIAWIVSWRILYLEVFRWHHMTRSLRFSPPPPLPGLDSPPKAGVPLIAMCVTAVVAPLAFITATLVERARRKALVAQEARTGEPGSLPAPFRLPGAVSAPLAPTGPRKRRAGPGRTSPAPLVR
jgi:hypothetical protein